jgi:hypothetical protein
MVVGLSTLRNPAIAETALLAPVESSPSPDAQALEYRPQPLSISVQVPNEVKVCMEATGERFDLLGSVQDQNKTYYLLGVYPDFVSKSPLDATDELIVTDLQEGCRRLVGVNSVAEPMSFYMPRAKAQDLELQRYQHDTALEGGTPAFQQDLTDHIKNNAGEYLLSNEQIQALHQLGVRFPSNYQLLQASKS